MNKNSEIKYAKVNTGYEYELFKEHVGEIDPEHAKMVGQWEFIFFFINKSENVGLSTSKEYSEGYLSFLKGLGLTLPPIKQVEGDFNWFGSLLNLELEKNLNSKLWSYRLLEKIGTPAPGMRTVESREEARKVIATSPKRKWILKSPYASSGTRMSIVCAPEEVPEIKHTHILEPFRERVVDLVYHYDPRTGKDFAYVSKPTTKGNYLGGMIFSTQAALMSYLERRGLCDSYSELTISWERIMRELLPCGLSQPLTIDSFIYNDEGSLRAYPMCEINYRVNMGTFLESLLPFIPQDGMGELIRLKSPPGRIVRDLFSYDRSSKTGVLCLNEEQASSAALLLAAENEHALGRLKLITQKALQSAK